jgi:hypothetical protein
MAKKNIPKDHDCFKSPFEKGGFRGISDSDKIPHLPPQGGIKTTSNQTRKAFFNSLLEKNISLNATGYQGRRAVRRRVGGVRVFP